MATHKQAVPPPTVFFGEEAFQPIDHTEVRWLGSGGMFVNTRGTCIMMDPMLKDFDMPLLIDMPIAPENIPHLDAVLITHCDNDHYSVPSLHAMEHVSKAFHGPHYVAELMQAEGFPANGHDIGDSFEVGPAKITLTPADHAWQNEKAKYNYRVFHLEDYCGFWIETPDGIIWAPGDSRLMKEQLELPQPDAILFDFSDNEWHIGLEGAIQMANTYPEAHLILCHWGTVDAPDLNVFNADPQSLYDRVVNPERIHAYAPGQPFSLKKS